LAGVPAAIDAPEVTADGCITTVPGDSALDVVASMPATGGDAEARAFEGFALATAPGIGLGSIAGLDSVCASAIAEAASVAGAGDVAKEGLCIQPRS
jgi:hypothetical protein